MRLEGEAGSHKFSKPIYSRLLFWLWEWGRKREAEIWRMLHFTCTATAGKRAQPLTFPFPRAPKPNFRSVPSERVGLGQPRFSTQTFLWGTVTNGDLPFPKGLVVSG